VGDIVELIGGYRVASIYVEIESEWLAQTTSRRVRSFATS
jgi:hypothetical protein